MDEKFKFWSGAALNALAWAYLVFSAAAVVVAAAGRFAVRVPGYGFGLIDAVLLLFALAVVLGGFWLLRTISTILTPAK